MASAKQKIAFIDRDGTIVGTVGGVSPEENVMTSLEIVQGLAGR